MIVAKSIDGCKTKEYDEWILAIREDFRKFKNYILPNYKNSTRLINEMNSFSYDIPFINVPKNLEFTIDVSDKYAMVEYPTYKEDYDKPLKDILIISRKYDEFIFINYNEDLAPVITRYYLQDNEILEDKIIKCIDMEWDEDLVQENLRILKGKSCSPLELGGFPDSIYDMDFDGDTEEEMQKSLNSYCMCLAEDYFNAMKNEDFERIGDLNYILLEQIKSSLRSIKDKSLSDSIDIEHLSSGNFLTNYGKLFVQSVARRRIMENVEYFLNNGSKEVEIYATWILYSEEYKKVSSTITLDYNILNRIPVKNKKELMEFLDDLFNVLDNKIKEISLSFKNLVNDDKKNEEIIKCEREKVIDTIRPYILNIKYLDSIEKLTNKYDWLKSIVNSKMEEDKKLTKIPNSNC